MASVISISGLIKKFGQLRALDELDLVVNEGEIHGFLGPNGAGKSTTIRVLLGLLQADAGDVKLLNGNPWKDATALHRRLTYIPGDVSLWPNLSGGEVIDFLGHLHGNLNRQRKNELLELFELDPRKKCRTYSKGNRQKVALIAALAADVELFILDEPTSGLDPLMEATFRTCLHALRSQGRTVLLSSHILAEVEELCDRVSIIRNGRTVESGTLTELRHLSRTTINAEVIKPPQNLQSLTGIHALEIQGNTIRCSVDAIALNEAIRILSEAGIRSLTSQPPTLEDLFLQYYEAETATKTGATK